MIRQSESRLVAALAVGPLLTVLCLAPSLSHAINVSTVANDGVTTAQITAALQGAGVTITNLTITNNGCANRNQAVGLFSQGTTPTGPGPVLGDDSGIVLGTGPLKTAGDFLVSPNSDPRWDNTLCTANVSDADMVLLEPQTANGEYIAIEFDIEPQYSTMAIPFQFGSDEFPEYVCTDYNDVTGIFVSGPGIAGPYSNSAQNYAKTPGGDLTSINWVNTGVVGSQGTLAQCGSLTNTAYYTDNSSGDLAGGNATVATTNANLELDGWTNYIYQPITVIPGQTYHVKAAIADAGDRQWDSAVFFHLIFSTESMLGFDFADAPDSYRTLTASGGPRHSIRNTIYLGANQPDNEVTGQPTAAANGDDTAGSDDEDGVGAFSALLATDTSYAVNVTVNNTTGATATLIGWIDFNRNGSFDTSEGVSVSVANGTVNGTATLNWTGLSGLVAGTTYARFRLTTDGTVTTATPGGTAGNGEVEDYALAILAPDLSTSTKSVLDVNGGDVEPGDILRYSITLIETAGMAANGVSVSDNLPANVTGFSNFTLPSGASYTFAPAPDGTNGTGLLDVTNITVPANTSVSISFEVTVSGAAGATIANTATINSPGRPSSTPSAPTLTISGGAVPGSGNKPLYLSGAPGYTLSRTPTAGTPAYITIAELGSQSWILSAPLEADVTIDPTLSPTVPVNLYMASNQARTISATVTLACSAGGSISQTLSEDLNVTPEIYNPPFMLPLGAPLTCPAGSTWQLTIRNNTSGIGTRDLRVYPVNGTDLNPAIPNGDMSQVILPSRDVISVDSITYYDAAYSGGTVITSAAPGQLVSIRATVSDPFGNYDINANPPATLPTITLTDPGGNPFGPVAMTELDALTTPGTKTFEYVNTVPGGSSAGSWTVRVDAVEGTEGTVSDYALAALQVVIPSANVTLVKATANIGTSGYDIPGETVRYTLVLTNADTRAIDNNSILLVDSIPANTALVAIDPVVTVTNPGGTGLTLNYLGLTNATDQVEFSTDGSDYGYQPVNSGGVDPSVTHIRFVPTGSMNGGTSFTVTFKVKIK